MTMTMTIRRILLGLAVLGGVAFGQTNIGPIKTTTSDSIGSALAPANPPSGICRGYFNSVTGQMAWINSSGGSCGPASGSGVYLPLAGGTMTGPIVFGATALSNPSLLFPHTSIFEATGVPYAPGQLIIGST